MGLMTSPMMKSTIAVDAQELSDEVNGSDLSDGTQDVDDSAVAF
jgi:hypothetical protein